MSENWKRSLHGGHSGDFCEHGQNTLREVLDAAVEFGYSTFGVTSHTPAGVDDADTRFLYSEELANGLTVADLAARFSEYLATARRLGGEYEDRVEILVGAEVEVVPDSMFVAQAQTLRDRRDIDYLVGSVHWVDGTPIDVTKDQFELAVGFSGDFQNFLIRYYELVGDMVEHVRPEVIGHIDLPRLFSEHSPDHDSTITREAIDSVLQKAASTGAILDLNVSALRKGLATPYCSPWIVTRATELGVPFCFGDDSHSVDQVGVGLESGRQYLLANGVETITTLTRMKDSISHKTVSLL